MKTDRLLSTGLPLLILFIATLLRFYGLDRLSLWADELWVVMGSAQGSLTDMMDFVHYHDNHPPGYYLLLRFTQATFGDSDFTLRFPSAIAGMSLVAATYMAGKKHFSWRAGVLAAALVSGSYQAIYYSQEARPNIFMALFALLALHYFCVVMLRKESAKKNVVLFILNAALASYFHYAGLVFCLCLGLWYSYLLAARRDQRTVQAGLWLFVPCALLYVPWLSGILHHLVATPVTHWQRPPNFQTLQTTFRFLFGPDTPRIVFYQLIVIAGIALAVFNPARRAMLVGLLSMSIAPVAIFYLKSAYSQDAYNHRHFLYAIPLLALVAGAVLNSLVERVANSHRNAVFLFLVATILSFQFIANNSDALYTANHFKQEFRESAQVVANDTAFLRDPRDPVLSNTVFFDHYLLRFTHSQHKSDFIFEQAVQREALRAWLAAQQATAFYYLEAPAIPAANQMVTAEDKALAEIWQPLCRTRFLRAQVFRFSVTAPSDAIDFSALPDCRKPLP